MYETLLQQAKLFDSDLTICGVSLFDNTGTFNTKDPVNGIVEKKIFLTLQCKVMTGTMSQHGIGFIEGKFLISCVFQKASTMKICLLHIRYTMNAR